ncbi:hypothetical protein Pcinc_008067 [Petrolisthes cinctipes]|nr:hypothetical protein Pcinc_008067 [Petrolisthes cinctipes]
MPPPTCGSPKDTQLPVASPIPNTENKQMPGSQITETTENRPLPVLSLPENQRPWSDEFSEVNLHSSVSSWDNVHVSQTSDLNFSDSYLGERRHSIPTSNLASESALSSLASGDYTSTKIIDRHMWASSDSFFCEDFTFCNRKGKVTLDQPRSYSQVLLRENQSEKSNDHSQASDDNEPSQDFSPGDTPEGMIFSPMGLKEVPDTPPLDRLSLGGESACVSSDSPHVTHSEIDAFKDNCNITIHYNSDSTQRHTDTTQTGREHWIQFDGGSQDQLNLDILVAQGTFTPSPLSLNLQSEMPDSQASDDSAAVTPSSPSDNCKTILSTIESGMVHSSGSYRGRLIRTYSQRGRRASKRVMNSVSRRMGQTTQEYGKVPEPKPPMYSKAAMTMQIGPGLFEQPTFTCDRSEDEAGSARSVEETKVSDEGKSSSLSDTMATTSFLETARAERVGSLRMPRLSTALVRRSLSLNTPRVEQGEVPFQRLSEHQPGSFRKAISGLGALARSFRRKSNSGPKVGSPDGSKKNNPVQASKTSNEIPSRETPKNVRRTESFKGGRGRQTPQAPRLPRRNITHKSVESEYPRQRPLQK